MHFLPFFGRIAPEKTSSTPMGTGIPVVRVAGIQISLDPSWFLILVVLTLSFFSHYLREFAAAPHAVLWAAAILSSLAFFASLVVHELSHSVLARLRGIAVEGITLFIFGGVSRLRSEPTRPKDEIVIGGVGPITSGALGGLFYLVWALVPEQFLVTRYALSSLGATNLVLAAFNLLPAFPMDGGRILRASIWLLSGSLKRATRVATEVSTAIAYGLIAIGVLGMLFGWFLGGLWFALIGWFLLSAARASLREAILRDALGRRRVHQVMHSPGLPVPPSETVENFVERRLLSGSERSAYVAGDGVQGWVTLREVKKLDRAKWENTPLLEIMIPFASVIGLKRQDSLFSALEKMNHASADQLPVVEEGELLGVVTREDLARVAAIDLELGETRSD